MTNEEKEVFRGRLKKAGYTVYTTVTHVAKSGMSRVITSFIIENNTPQCIDYAIAQILDNRFHKKHQGLVVHGCGMDMGFSLVYDLSRVLWPKGFICRGERKCPSNDHNNGSRDYSKHLHSSGGYCLIQKWL